MCVIKYFVSSNYFRLRFTLQSFYLTTFILHLYLLYSKPQILVLKNTEVELEYPIIITEVSE